MKKKKIKFMDVALILMAVLLLIFTVKMIKLYELTGGIPDTLVTCVFAALTGEAGFMAIITRQKIKERNRAAQEAEKPEPEPDGADDVSAE